MQTVSGLYDQPKSIIGYIVYFIGIFRLVKHILLLIQHSSRAIVGSIFGLLLNGIILVLFGYPWPTLYDYATKYIDSEVTKQGSGKTILTIITKTLEVLEMANFLVLENSFLQRLC